MTETLASQKKAIEAAATIARVFPHLPAAQIGVSHVYPDQVEISLHESLADFEAWREALGILPDAVSRKDLATEQQHLGATGRFAGAAVVLNGFAPQLAEVA